MASFEAREFTGADLRMKIPFGALVVGPQQAGKSTFLEEVVEEKDEIFDPPPESVVYAYGCYDKRIVRFQKRGAIIVAGAPSDDLLERIPKPAVLILDDLMSQMSKAYLDELFTKKAHHMNLGVFLVLQNLFDKSSVVSRVNSQYIFLMRAPNAALQIKNLGTFLRVSQNVFMRFYAFLCVFTRFYTF